MTTDRAYFREFRDDYNRCFARGRAALPRGQGAAEVGGIGDAERESLVAEGPVWQQRRLATVSASVDRVAPARRSVAHGIGDERHREAEGADGLTYLEGIRPADREN